MLKRSVHKPRQKVQKLNNSRYLTSFVLGAVIVLFLLLCIYKNTIDVLNFIYSNFNSILSISNKINQPRTSVEVDEDSSARKINDEILDWTDKNFSSSELGVSFKYPAWMGEAILSSPKLLDENENHYLTKLITFSNSTIEIIIKDRRDRTSWEGRSQDIKKSVFDDLEASEIWVETCYGGCFMERNLSIPYEKYPYKTIEIFSNYNGDNNPFTYDDNSLSSQEKIQLISYGENLISQMDLKQNNYHSQLIAQDIIGKSIVLR